MPGFEVIGQEEFEQVKVLVEQLVQFEYFHHPLS